MLKHSFIISILTVLLLSLTISCTADKAESSDSSNQAMAQTETQNASAIILDPSATEWAAMDIDGNLHHYNEWVGKQPVVLNFWGSWCPPCRREIPELVKMYDEFNGKGVKMIGLAGGSDTPEKVRAFTSQNGMKWTMLMVNQHALEQFGITGFPTTVFLDKTGKEVGRFVGPRSYELFKQAFESII